MRPPVLMHKPRAAGFEVLLSTGTIENPKGPLLPQRSKRRNSPLAERVTWMLLGAANRCSTSSPVFKVPFESASTNTNQPQSQSDVPEASGQPLVPVSSLRMTTLPPRLMASERARYRADCRLSVASRTRQRSMMGVKLGAAKAASTATMATTTMVSIRVKPRCDRWARVRISAYMAAMLSRLDAA